MYLEAEFPVVEPRAELAGMSGTPYRVTAAAGNDERQVYIQTAAGRNAAAQRTAVEHCYTMFSDVNGHLPSDRTLVVLDDEAPEWRPEAINLLSTVAFVGHVGSTGPLDRVRLGRDPRVASVAPGRAACVR